jgi:ribosomal protein L7/L12
MKMKLLTASIVIGPLMVIGALSAVAGQSAQALGSRAAVQVAAAADSAADRESYARKAQDELREWQHKLREFGDQAAASGKAAGNAANDDLNQARTKAEAASDRLQTVGAEGWESAKASFEKASHDLADTWHRVHPDDK